MGHISLALTVANFGGLSDPNFFDHLKSCFKFISAFSPRPRVLYALVDMSNHIFLNSKHFSLAEPITVIH